MRILRAFAASEAGAVSVDWVVLTAAIVAMGTLALYPVVTQVPEISADITPEMETQLNADAGSTAYSD